MVSAPAKSAVPVSGRRASPDPEVLGAELRHTMFFDPDSCAVNLVLRSRPELC